MIGHQRDVLSALGIDIWIPRETLCQNQPHSQVWRDQATPEIITTLVQPQVVIARTESIPAQRMQVEKVVEQPSELPPVQPIVVETLQPVLEIESFSIQAAVLKHCMLLIDATTLNEQEQLLWSNIQRATPCDFVELQWPFAWDNAQNGRGAVSYLNGFMDAYLAGQPVLALGHIPYLETSTAVQLASLSEMLAQPLLKKRLWQFMQNKPNME